MPWNPRQYERFESPRLRPGLELLAAVSSLQPSIILDLGCGTGKLTRLLAEQWPEAKVHGLDNSKEMLEQAARESSTVHWQLGEISTWTPERPVGLIFSNAALHWLPAHDELFARLIGWLAPGGVLAIQMPRNHGAPSHQTLRETAEKGLWAERLEGLLPVEPVHAPATYWRMLSRKMRRVELWETEYLHVLEGDDPVLEWMKGTALLPMLEVLEAPEQAEFLSAYSERLRAAYPKEANGQTLFAFRRLFLVAQR